MAILARYTGHGSHRLWRLGRLGGPLLACLIVLLALLILWPIKNGSQIATKHVAPSGTRQVCVAREGGLTSEGMGSFFQHVKSSIIFTQAIGGELFIKNIPQSKHGYNVSIFFRSTPCTTPTDGCTINDTRLAQLLPSICAGAYTDSQLMEAMGIQGCESVQHHSTWERREDFNDCVSPWYRRMMEPHISSTPPGACVRIGVHIRWGDLASSKDKIRNDTKLDTLRNIPLAAINTALQNIETVKCQCREVYVYAKAFPGFETDVFAADEYTLVDTGNDLQDLVHYMGNDILIQGTSSYAVLAAFASRDKLIITDDPSHPKYSQRFILVNRMFKHGEHISYVCP